MTITTAEELDALPVRAVVLDKQGDPWVRHTASLGPWVSPETRSCHSERLARKWGPLTVLYRPDQPTEVASASDVQMPPESLRERMEADGRLWRLAVAAAANDQPARVLPSVEDIEELDRHINECEGLR